MAVSQEICFIWVGDEIDSREAPSWVSIALEGELEHIQAAVLGADPLLTPLWDTIDVCLASTDPSKHFLPILSGYPAFVKHVAQTTPQVEELYAKVATLQSMRHSTTVSAAAVPPDPKRHCSLI